MWDVSARCSPNTTVVKCLFLWCRLKTQQILKIFSIHWLPPPLSSSLASPVSGSPVDSVLYRICSVGHLVFHTILLLLLYWGYCNLERLEIWADRNLLKLNKDKCKDLGQNNPHASVQAAGLTSWRAALPKMCCRSWWTTHSAWPSSVPWPPAVGHHYPRLYEQEGSQQAERSHSSPLFGTYEIESGVLCRILDSLVKEGHWQTEVNSVEGHCGGMFSGWPLALWGEAEGPGLLQEGRLRHDLIAVFRYLMGEVREDRARLF